MHNITIKNLALFHAPAINLYFSYNYIRFYLAAASYIVSVQDIIVKPHHEEDIFVITRGRGRAEAKV